MEDEFLYMISSLICLLSMTVTIVLFSIAKILSKKHGS